MIVFKLHAEKFGRLGNMLFQVAATLSHAIECGTTARFPKWTYRDYFLHPVDDSLDEKYDCIFDGTEHDIFNQGKDFHYHPIPRKKNLILAGFFQSEKYWQQHKAKVLRHFIPRPDFLSQVRRSASALLHLQQATAVHIRRGDYVEKQNYHPVLPLSYYSKAILEVIQMQDARDFIFFSDDIAWCKENFKGIESEMNYRFPPIRFHFVPMGSDIHDLFMGALFNNHIIANSSYSWWMAYLHQLICPDQSGQLVIAPAQWFGPDARHDTKDLYLPEWIKI